jgi:hypothetical protein
MATHVDGCGHPEAVSIRDECGGGATRNWARLGGTRYRELR